jgi:DNA-binding NtrC family response regulator
MKPRILVVEDDPDGLRSVVESVEDMGFEAVAAPNAARATALLAEQPFDAVLSDLVLPDRDGLTVLEDARRADPNLPFLIMTAYGTVSTAVKALKSGAYDYITKPLDLDDIQTKLARAVETRRLRSKVDDLQTSLKRRHSADTIVARSPAMAEVIEQIAALARTNATVFIQGESGTGKELAAKALHYDGSRANGPFVAVNCGAFTESLLESELFGHEKGAFTGALRQHRGAFERADGGTLFLDEIGDAPKPVQVKLLRVLEEREIVRVGGQETLPMDVRLISASNHDLDALVADGRFREDLLYRLKVVTIEIPPLRSRREDIRPLADRFIAAACEEHGRHVETVGPDFYAALEDYTWPGNVRQLRNAIESSVILAREPRLIAASLRLGEARRDEEPQPSVPTGRTLAEMERDILAQVLERNRGNRTLTAEQLGISRRTIQRKIREHNLPF